MTLRDMMTAEVVTAEPDTTLEEIAINMRDEDTGAIPVIDDGELVGIVTDRDIVTRCIAQGKECSEMVAEDVMTRDVDMIEVDASLEDASRLMSEKQVRRLPVVDENGAFVGMLSLGDMAIKEPERPQDRAGSALKQISRGVKRAAPHPETSEAIEKPKQAGENEKKSSSRKTQGIGNHADAEERERQGRVIEFREQGLRTPRRKTG